MMSAAKVYLELTSRCNLNCSICYRYSWDEKMQDMNKELFDKAIHDIENIRSVKTVVLGGVGEPSCAPYICEAIEKLKRYEIVLTTNALHIDEGLLNAVVRFVGKIVVSIDGLHDNFFKIRGADLHAVINNVNRINALKKANGRNLPFVGLQYVISKDNVDDLFGMIDLANSLNAHNIILANLIPQNRENSAKILYTRYENPEVAHLFKKIISYSSRKGVNILFPNYELKTERRCSFIDDNATFITALGEVVPCYRMSHAYTEYIFGRKKTVLKHVFGNISNDSLQSIWESKRYASFRNMVRTNQYPSCIDCDLAEGCDMVKDTSCDCYAGSPSCADCLWARKITFCP